MQNGYYYEEKPVKDYGDKMPVKRILNERLISFAFFTIVYTFLFYKLSNYILTYMSNIDNPHIYSYKVTLIAPIAIIFVPISAVLSVFTVKIGNALTNGFKKTSVYNKLSDPVYRNTKIGKFISFMERNSAIFVFVLSIVTLGKAIGFSGLFTGIDDGLLISLLLSAIGIPDLITLFLAGCVFGIARNLDSNVRYPGLVKATKIICIIAFVVAITPVGDATGAIFAGIGDELKGGETAMLFMGLM